MIDSDDSFRDDSLTDSVSSQPRTRALGQGPWTDEEHDRFLSAMALFPRGPWSSVAAYIGTRTARQTMTHAQKGTRRRARHARGLRPPGRVAGPNARRRIRRRTTHRRESPAPSPPSLRVSYASEPGIDQALALLFATPLPSCDIVALHGLAPSSPSPSSLLSGSDDLLRPVDWLDDFVQSVDLSDFEPHAAWHAVV